MTEIVASQSELEGLVSHSDLIVCTYGNFSTDEGAELVVTSLACAALRKLINCIPRIAEKINIFC